MNEFTCASYTHREGQVQNIPPMGRKIKNFLEREEISNYVFARTCNRAEAYFFSDLSQDSVPEEITWRSDKEAFEHLLEVVSGTDSLVTGETEILNQIREAYKRSVSEGRARSELKKVFDWALKFGKKVRRETAISTGKTSVASIGLDYARNILEGFAGKKAIIIGAGRMGAKVARFLGETGVQSILVANRTYEKAVELADEVEGESYRLSELPDLLRKAEIIICATSAPHYILTEDKIDDLDERKILLDLSVPTNVHPGVEADDRIEYISYEELSSKARENLLGRAEEVEEVEKMIKREVERFLREDPYEGLYKKVEAIRKKQVKKAKKELKKRGEEEVLRDLSRSLSEKILSMMRDEIETGEN